MISYANFELYVLITTLQPYCCYCYYRSFKWYWSGNCKGTCIARRPCRYGSPKSCCWVWVQDSNHQRNSKCKSWSYGVGSQFYDINQEICVEIQFLGPSSECTRVSGIFIYKLIIDLFAWDWYFLWSDRYFLMTNICEQIQANYCPSSPMLDVFLPDLFGPCLGPLVKWWLWLMRSLFQNIKRVHFCSLFYMHFSLMNLTQFKHLAFKFQ